jgi:mRNA degradation ribonuclease J1/J2
MIRSDETTVLMGSGFGSISRSGREYSTFPDMRLIFSEKDRIRAWILTDASIDVARFELILPTLGFPPIYATREVIAAFRNSITNTAFLESCRFFELFADGTSMRRIGDIECVTADVDLTSHLGFRSGGSTFAFAHIPLTSADLGTSVAAVITPTTDGFSIGTEPFITGEVLSLKWGVISRNAMKFTFDTFFVDGLSIGVVAGYALGDRDQLAESGVVIFTLEEDTRARTIAGHIFIDSRGFVHAYEMMYIHKEILKGIRQTYEKLIVENPKVERGELVQWLRREITKYCYLLTGRTPVVMPIVIER